MGLVRAHKALIGYLILAAAIVVGFYFNARNSNTITNERAARSRQLNSYLVKQCARDKDRDAIFIELLEQSKQSVATSPRYDPETRKSIIDGLTKRIERLKAIDVRCVAEIPPPLPAHRTT